MKIFTKNEEIVLLAIYNLEPNAYLVTIREYILENTENDLSFGTLHVLLNRLDKSGYIENYVGEATAKRGGKAIKFFSLTDYGLNALKEMHKVNNALWVNFIKNNS